MEESQNQVHEETPSYWTSVGVAGLLFGIISFILTLIYGYSLINSEPSGSMFSPIMLIWLVSCLLTAFGGMVATWHYANQYDVVIKLGKGALIGFLTGACIVIVSVILNEIWHLIDPEMTQKMIDSTIANFEKMEMPADQKQQIIDSTVDSMRTNQNIGRQLLFGIPIMGIVNLITGMIGAKLFGKKEETL